MEKNLGFYSGKTVLVTGHTGFKGSWLCTWLLELGAKVVGYSLDPPTNPNMYNALNLNDKVTSVFGDVKDAKQVDATFKRYKPEIVFHLAAQPIVRRSFKEPQLTFETNVMGTVNVLDAVRKTPCSKRVIVVTSDKCYENIETNDGYKETDRLGGKDPYSSSKACAELVVSAYRQSFFKAEEQHQAAIASVRAGNVIGGGDWGEDRLVPDCIRALQAGKEIIIRNPASIRPWQHVLEPLSGYLLLGTKLKEDRGVYATSWNFGPSEKDGITVEEIVKSIIAQWGQGNYQIDSLSKGPKEAHMLKLNCVNAFELLGWNPVFSIKEAIGYTIAWYKGHLFNKNPREMYAFTVKQISEYMARGNYKSEPIRDEGRQC
jgi:CDP-glucose 4,6-dehydratase